MASWDCRRTGRLVVVAVAITAGVMLVVVAGFAIHDHVAPWVLWRVALGFLFVVEASYAAAVVAVVAGLPALGVAFHRARGDRTSRLRIARGLALGVSTALALALAEGSVAV